MRIIKINPGAHFVVRLSNFHDRSWLSSFKLHKWQNLSLVYIIMKTREVDQSFPPKWKPLLRYCGVIFTTLSMSLTVHFIIQIIYYKSKGVFWASLYTPISSEMERMRILQVFGNIMKVFFYGELTTSIGLQMQNQNNC